MTDQATDMTDQATEQHYRPAAEAGDPTAMAWLGWALLRQGRHADAEPWCARAADAGELSAMTNLGVLLDRRKETEAAWVWWRRAAGAGRVDAMRCLARSLHSKHPEEAERWGWYANAATRDQRADEVPAEVTAAAEAAGLGPCRATYGRETEPDSLAVLVVVTSIIAAVPAGVAVLLYVLNDSPPMGWIIGLLALAAAIVVAVCYLRSSTRDDISSMVWVFQRGLVHRNPKGTLSVRPWTEIRLLRDITRHYRDGRYQGTTFRYTITHTVGPEIVLNAVAGIPFTTEELFLLGETIERDVAAVRMPTALAALRRGKRLDFGDLTIDTTGITGSQGTLPWGEVEEIGVKEGKLRVRRADAWLSWSKAPVSAIPDLSVLLALAHALRDAARSAS